jgi:hypothetical protein
MFCQGHNRNEESDMFLLFKKIIRRSNDITFPDTHHNWMNKMMMMGINKTTWLIIKPITVSFYRSCNHLQ